MVEEEEEEEGEVSTQGVAARVAFHKARREGFAVELREFSRAFIGVHGRDPTVAECEADVWFRSISLNLKHAAKALQRAQVQLTAAQAKDRAEMEQEEASAVKLRKKEKEERALQAAVRQDELTQKEQDLGRLLELMQIADKLMSETGSVIPGGGGMLAAAPAEGGVMAAAGEVLVQQQLLQMMEAMQSKLDKMQQTQDEIAEENKKLRENSGGGGKRGKRTEEEEEEDEDATMLKSYKSSSDQVMGSLQKGSAPSAQMYAERDLHLFRLSDSDLKAEYERYTQMYLDDRTPAQVRGMAEMTLIKLGEIVDKPQAKRVKMVEKAAEEQRAAVESRKRDAEASQKAGAEKYRQEAMNKLAFDTVAPVWRSVAAAKSLQGSSEVGPSPQPVSPPLREVSSPKPACALTSNPLHIQAVRALAKRLQNRSELQLVVLDPAMVRALPPAKFQACHLRYRRQRRRGVHR